MFDTLTTIARLVEDAGVFAYGNLMATSDNLMDEAINLAVTENIPISAIALSLDRLTAFGVDPRYVRHTAGRVGYQLDREYSAEERAIDGLDDDDDSDFA